MSASVLVLQHAAPEGPGAIEDALRDRGVSIDVVHTHAGEPVPESNSVWKGLVVMGGPMGVYDEGTYPHLGAEIRLIRTVLREGLPILGVCLGSQLLAAALGARVAPATREIGWYPVELSAEASRDPLWMGIPNRFTPFHWHGDAFDLPPGCVSLARSERTVCQAFSYEERAYGLLFHLEVTEPMVVAMTDAFAHELESAGADRDRLVDEASRELPAVRGIAETVFGRWADRIGSGSTRHPNR